VFGVNSSIISKVSDAGKRTRKLGYDWADKLGLQYGVGRGQFLTHGEAMALMRAYKKTGGKMPSEMTMYVDRETCSFCAPENGGALADLVQAMGIDKLTIYMKNGEVLRVSGGRFVWQ
jgi:hypothetical protein